MKTLERPTPDGVRTARALLGLVEDHSPEDFQAAEAILSGQGELVHVLRLLREFKDQSLAEQEPVSHERLRAIVRDELLGLQGTKQAFNDYLSTLGIVLRVAANSTFEEVVDEAVNVIERDVHRPSDQTRALAGLLQFSAADVGPEQAQRIDALLRDLAIRAIAENVVMFSTLHAISQLRTRWAPTPLPYNSEEPRERLTARLFKDAERLAPDQLPQITLDLLTEGLRGPADGAIAETRRMQATMAPSNALQGQAHKAGGAKARKAHGQ